MQVLYIIISTFLFFEIMQLLIEETNRYYDQHLDMIDKGHTLLLNMTLQEMCLFLSIILQMGAQWEISGPH
jgi:hypothetical protein